MIPRAYDEWEREVWNQMQILDELEWNVKSKSRGFSTTWALIKKWMWEMRRENKHDEDDGVNIQRGEAKVISRSRTFEIESRKLWKNRVRIKRSWGSNLTDIC